MKIDDTARAIRATRAEFAALFREAQEVFDVKTVIDLNVVAGSGSDLEVFKKGLRYAGAHGWMQLLVNLLIVNEMADESLVIGRVDHVAPVVTNGQGSLEAITNAAQGFDQPDLFVKGMIRNMKTTGKVFIDGHPMGTCLLVGYNVVLTAWHVVRILFDSDGNPLANSHERLEVEFDDVWIFNGAVRTNKDAVVYKAHKAWNVVHNCCHQSELDDTIPEDCNHLGNHLDYALVRLERVASIDRKFENLEITAEVPKPNEKLILLQHAGGFQLQFDSNLIIDKVKEGINCDSRFLHISNATAGASGGPCFDKNFKLFGIHQGKWKSSPKDKVFNKGIPITRIKDDFKKRIREIPRPDPEDFTLWQLESTGYPVIGRDNLQHAVWKSIDDQEKRLFNIRGKEGYGRTFCAELMANMLSSTKHLKIELDAMNIAELDAEALANLIAKSIGGAPLQVRSVDEINSTATVWLRDEILPALLKILNEKRDNRLVWIFIKDLNKADLVGLHTPDLLNMLYVELNRLSWLRIVLDGMRSIVPAEARNIELVYNCNIKQTDVETYLLRFFSEYDIPGEEHVSRNASHCIQKVDSDERCYMKALSMAVIDFVAHYHSVPN